jgi:hypothetical protein
LRIPLIRRDRTELLQTACPIGGAKMLGKSCDLPHRGD